MTVFIIINRYLHVTGDQFGRPIHGQREVSGYSYPELGNEWKTMVRIGFLISKSSLALLFERGLSL